MCRLILIASGWPTKPWFWDLVEMSLDVPRQLPQIRTLLKQPCTEQPLPHQPGFLQPPCLVSRKPVFQQYGFTVGVQLSKNAGSLQKWQKELLLLKDSQREPSTPQNGQFFKNSAQRNRWTSGIHL